MIPAKYQDREDLQILLQDQVILPSDAEVDAALIRYTTRTLFVFKGPELRLVGSGANKVDRICNPFDRIQTLVIDPDDGQIYGFSAQCLHGHQGQVTYEHALHTFKHKEHSRQALGQLTYSSLDPLILGARVFDGEKEVPTFLRCGPYHLVGPQATAQEYRRLEAFDPRRPGQYNKITNYSNGELEIVKSGSHQLIQTVVPVLELEDLIFRGKTATTQVREAFDSEDPERAMKTLRGILAAKRIEASPYEYLLTDNVGLFPTYRVQFDTAGRVYHAERIAPQNS